MPNRARLPIAALAVLAALALMGCVQAGAEPSAMHDTPVTEPHPTAVGSPHPLRGSCASTFSADRCQAMALHAAIELNVPFERIDALDVVPDPSPPQMDRAHRVFLSITLIDGSRHDVTISCPGVAGAYDPPCMSDPALPIGYPRGSEGGGYTDIPENSTPFPDLDPAAVAAAQPLEIATLTIPITELGPRTVVLGNALLANGYLAEGQFGLADPWPSNVLFAAAPRMEVRPVAGGEPLWNLYEHGWYEGVEEVEATLTFDVAWFEPGAELAIVDVVVR